VCDTYSHTHIQNQYLSILTALRSQKTGESCCSALKRFTFDTSVFVERRSKQEPQSCRTDCRCRLHWRSVKNGFSFRNRPYIYMLREHLNVPVTCTVMVLPFSLSSSDVVCCFAFVLHCHTNPWDDTMLSSLLAFSNCPWTDQLTTGRAGLFLFLACVFCFLVFCLFCLVLSFLCLLLSCTETANRLCIDPIQFSFVSHCHYDQCFH
jgi:hypothetical protein